MSWQDGRDCMGDYRGYQKTVGEGKDCGVKQELRVEIQEAEIRNDGRAQVEKNEGDRSGRPGVADKL